MNKKTYPSIFSSLFFLIFFILFCFIFKRLMFLGIFFAGLLFLSLLMLISRLIEEKRGKNAASLAIKRLAVFLGVSAAIIMSVAQILILSSAKTDSDINTEYVIILGAGVNGYTPSLSLQNRIDKAVGFLKDKPDMKIIASGAKGTGELISEALAIKNALVSRGVKEDRIILEEKSTSTYENIKFSLEKIADSGNDTPDAVAVLTSDYHVYRAKYMLKTQGVIPYSVAAKTTLPAVLTVNYYLREIFAIVFTWVFG